MENEAKTYRVVVEGEEIETEEPGQYAGWRPGRIFGKLACRTGMRMKPENRIFFADMHEAIECGYRPCQKCQPMNEDDFESFSETIPEQTLQDFYNRNKK